MLVRIWLLFSSLLATPRMWTDIQGRQIEAVYISATDTAAQVQRTSDHLLFSIPLIKLCEADRKFVLSLKESVLTEDRDFKYPEGSGETVDEVSAKPNHPIQGDADRLMVPSMGEDQLGARYPRGAACIMNFLIWWGEHLYPDYLSADSRKEVIEELEDNLFGYFERSSSTMDETASDLLEYSKREVDDYEIILRTSLRGASLQELAKWTNDWNGVVALCGFYERSGSRLHRVGAKYCSVVQVSGSSVILNARGEKHILVSNGETVPVVSLPQRNEKYMRYHKVKTLEAFYDDAQQFDDLVPEGGIVLFEDVLVFEIRKAPESG